MQNATNWFEIPVNDMARAKAFYEAILECEMPENTMGEFDMAFFPCDREAVGGALIKGNMCSPSKDGSKIYLNCGDDLQPVLDRVVEQGGSIVVPKTLITEEIGYFGWFEDSEGNWVALHSMK